jgi:hypothetical protein
MYQLHMSVTVDNWRTSIRTELQQSLKFVTLWPGGCKTTHKQRMLLLGTHENTHTHTLNVPGACCTAAVQTSNTYHITLQKLRKTAHQQLQLLALALLPATAAHQRCLAGCWACASLHSLLLVLVGARTAAAAGYKQRQRALMLLHYSTAAHSLLRVEPPLPFSPAGKHTDRKHSCRCQVKLKQDDVAASPASRFATQGMIRWYMCCCTTRMMLQNMAELVPLQGSIIV